MKANELRKLDASQLKEKLASLLKERFKLRMMENRAEHKQHHLWGGLKKDIARVKTIMNEQRENRA